MSQGIDELQRELERTRLLYQVSRVIHSSLEPRQALDLILAEARRLTKATAASIALVNPTTGLLEIEADQGLPEEAKDLRLRLGEGITGWVARTGRSACVGNVHQDPHYLPVREDTLSELAVPMDVNDQVRGVLNVDADSFDAFTEQDRRLLAEMAVQAAKVIHNTWLYEQIRLKARMLESLTKVNQVIHMAVNLDEALEAITKEASKLIAAKMCSLMLLDGKKEWLELRASFGAGSGYRSKPRLSVEESVAGIVLRRQRPIQLADVRASSLYHDRAVAVEEGLISLLCAPLVFGGASIGVLNVYTGQPHSFSDDEIRIFVAFGSISADVIERARLNEHVRSVEEQLRRNEKLSALGLLAAEVAHEIRNPLTVMKMMYHSLHLQFPGSDPRAQDARVLGEKMDQLDQIVTRILSFARGSEPRFERTNLNRLIDDLHLLTRHRFKKQRIELVRDLESDLPPVMADSTQLEQAFLNLTLNALEAMPRGGRLTIATRVHLAPHPESGVAQIAVEFHDTGEGMSREQSKKVFSSFLTSEKKEGTGLGLAIVKKIVEGHRGRVSLSSSRGKGTTFRVFLPLT